MFASPINPDNVIIHVPRNFETYNVAKLRILFAVFQLSDLGIEPTSKSISEATQISMSGVCHFTNRYVADKLLVKKPRKQIKTKTPISRREAGLSAKTIFRYEITLRGKE